jgi:hypothetical protein
LLSMAEFAILWMLVACLSAVGFALVLDAAKIDEDSGIGLGLLWALIAIPAASYFPATILIGGATPAGRHLPRRKRKLAGAMAGVTILFLAALIGGALLGDEVQKRRNREQDTKAAVTLQTLSCTYMDGGSIVATGLVTFGGAGARAISRSDLFLQLGRSEDFNLDADALPVTRTLKAAAWANPNDPPYLVVSQSAPRLISVRFMVRGPVPDAACRLFTEGSEKSDWVLMYGEVIEGPSDKNGEAEEEREAN